MIYTKKIGDSWTLCNAGGFCVGYDGFPVEHPLFFDEQPAGYPVFEKSKK